MIGGRKIDPMKLSVASIHVQQLLSAVNEWGRLQEQADAAFERVKQIKDGLGPLEKQLLKALEESQGGSVDAEIGKF